MTIGLKTMGIGWKYELSIANVLISFLDLIFLIDHTVARDHVLLLISFRNVILQMKGTNITLYSTIVNKFWRVVFNGIHSFLWFLKNKLSWEHFNSANCESDISLGIKRRKIKFTLWEAKYTTKVFCFNPSCLASDYF